jgi:glycosidase
MSKTVDLLVNNLAENSARTLAMQQVASEGGFDWWQAELDTGAQAAIHSYMFRLRDGKATIYCADDWAKDGGVGQLAQTKPYDDQGWDIYTYTPGFVAPEWAENAIIYQIFPDRFRNGDPTNDQTADRWFYPDERGHAFPITPWNTIVPDPMPADSAENPQWYGTWSNTFYGGDLQGVQEKLDALQELGVTTIYFNPIFDSPSNHRYDGRDYRVVDDSLAVAGDAEASMALFDAFAAEVEQRGMHLILDGVPNHSSSDSPQFDRFGRHDAVGACEAEDSPYRSWYFFDPARPAGGGDCAGDTNYRGWAGVATLPQANTANDEVIDAWLGEDGIVRQWLSKPGVDGWRIDVVPDVVLVNPSFFEQMRIVAKEVNPDALLISETWAEKDARLRLLGDEFDSTMNYRFRQALLGFLRDSDFSEDNDGGVVALTAGQFEAALRAIQEDYPPAAFASAMNLLGSHDVNRAVRVLDHDGIDYAAQQPVNDFVDGRARLALAAVLQLTLPGAPTIYYGDEVGLVGFGSDVPRDDPYNRQPYPWTDADGYDSLPDWRKQDGELLAHYQKLGQLRNRHSFLRTGSWDTLLIDDAGLIVYGRKDSSGAAIVTLNRSAVTQTVSINVAGYLPFGADLRDPFGDAAVTVSDGSIVDAGLITYTVPAMSYQLWLTGDEIDLTAPAAPTVTVSEGDGFVDLSIMPVDGAIQYAVYRSFVDGGYQEMFVTGGQDTPIVASDAELDNGVRYFYRVAQSPKTACAGPLSEPVTAIPHAQIASAALVEPLTLNHTLSAITPTAVVQGLVVIPGLSEAEGATPGVIAQLGVAPLGEEGFIWREGVYAGELDGGDLYTATLLPETSGEFSYQWRFSNSDGREWTSSANQGTLTVAPAADTEPPKPPFRLDEISRSGSSIALAWRVSRGPDLHSFRICRADLTVGEQGCATQFSAPKATNVYTDSAVSTGHTYSYTVQVLDTSFNASLPSKPITLTAELALVEVTWRVRVPAETPPADEVFIAGDDAVVFGASYNPGLTPMTPVGEGSLGVVGDSQGRYEAAVQVHARQLGNGGAVGRYRWLCQPPTHRREGRRRQDAGG